MNYISLLIKIRCHKNRVQIIYIYLSCTRINKNLLVHINKHINKTYKFIEYLIWLQQWQNEIPRKIIYKIKICTSLLRTNTSRIYSTNVNFQSPYSYHTFWIVGNWLVYQCTSLTSKGRDNNQECVTQCCHKPNG